MGSVSHQADGRRGRPQGRAAARAKPALLIREADSAMRPEWRQPAVPSRTVCGLSIRTQHPWTTRTGFCPAETLVGWAAAITQLPRRGDFEARAT